MGSETEKTNLKSSETCWNFWSSNKVLQQNSFTRELPNQESKGSIYIMTKGCWPDSTAGYSNLTCCINGVLRVLLKDKCSNGPCTSAPVKEFLGQLRIPLQFPGSVSPLSTTCSAACFSMERLLGLVYFSLLIWSFYNQIASFNAVILVSFFIVMFVEHKKTILFLLDTKKDLDSTVHNQ